jgi:plasmid stabilization system protein ParE
MNVVLSKLAIFKLEMILGYLEDEWSETSRDKFLSLFNQKVILIRRFPQLYQISKKDQKLRKCVVSKHVSFYYEVNDDAIHIITISDNRQDETKLRQELDTYFKK